MKKTSPTRRYNQKNKTPSEFSLFFRKSKAEQEPVLLDIVKKANKEQEALEARYKQLSYNS